MVRRLASECVRAGSIPALAQASMYLAEVPKKENPASSAKSKSTLPSGWKGEPS